MIETDLQECVLNLMKELDEICTLNGIEYCVCGGCALGIERHNGFIPWDDDVDIFITRENLNKLNNVFASQLPSNRAWVTEENSDGYDSTLPRYIDLTTTQIIRSRMPDGTPNGVAIEFFVLDPFPNEREEQFKYRKYHWLYCELRAERYMLAKANHFDVVDEKLYYEYLERVKEEGKEKVLKEIETNFLTYQEEDCDYYIARWGVRDSIVRKEWLKNLERRNFEGLSLPFFKENMMYLSVTEYGYNWDYLPPVKERVSHNNIEKHFLNVPTEDYREQIAELVNASNFDAELKEAKRRNLQIKFIDVMQQEAEADVLLPFVEEQVKSISDRVESFDFSKLHLYSYALSPYLRLQLNKRYYQVGRRAETSDKFLEIVLLYLIHVGRINDCRVILSVYDDREPCLKYQEVIDALNELKIRKYEENVARVDELIDTLVNRFHIVRQVEVERAMLWRQLLDYIKNGTSEFLVLYEGLKYKNDTEIQKYLADYYYARGDTKIAQKIYTSIMSTTNGMLRKNIEGKGIFA